MRFAGCYPLSLVAVLGSWFVLLACLLALWWEQTHTFVENGNGFQFSSKIVKGITFYSGRRVFCYGWA